MSGSPIFDQLQAEFLEQSKFARLSIGPLLEAEEGPKAFERVEVINEHFGTTGYIHRLIQTVEETPETVDEIEVVEKPKPRLYVVDGAPKLIDLASVKDEDSTDEVAFASVPEETEMEKTISIPRFEHEKPEPPSIASDETQLIPVVPEVNEEQVQTPEKPADDRNHVTPIRKPKAIRKTAHRKLSATGTLGWFANHNRAA